MESAGIGSPLLTAAIQYIINVVMTLPAIFWLDKWGRRPLMLIGALGMSALLFAAGGLQATYGKPYNDPDAELTWGIEDHVDASRGIVALSYLFVAVFATTWGPISWTYPAEIFANKIRAKAVSLSTASNWTTNTILAFAVPPLLSSINWRIYMIFGTFNALAFIHIFFTAPETKNFTLEEMDAVFEGSGGRPWRRHPMPGSTVPKASTLDELERQIAHGDVKVNMPGNGEVEDCKPIMVETVIEMTNTRRASLASADSSEIEAASKTPPLRNLGVVTPVEWYHAR